MIKNINIKFECAMLRADNFSFTLNSREPLKKLMLHLELILFRRIVNPISYTPDRELLIYCKNIKSKYMSQFIYHSDNHNLTIEQHINKFYPEKKPDDFKTIQLLALLNLNCDPNQYVRYGLAAFSYEDAKKLIDHEAPDSMYSPDLSDPVKLNNRYYDREKLASHLKNQLIKYSKSMSNDDLVCPSGNQLPAELIRAINHIRNYNINIDKNREKENDTYGYHTIQELYGPIKKGEIQVALEHLWKKKTDLKEYTQQLKDDLDKIKNNENKNTFFQNTKLENQPAPSYTNQSSNDSNNNEKREKCVIC